jgi:membrane fusion protein, epimerase transport system
MNNLHSLKSTKPEVVTVLPTDVLPKKIERQEKLLRIGGLVAVLLLFGGLGVWSVLAPLDSAAIGSGLVIVENYRKPIAHLEGGIVREVNVKEGQHVHKGEVLLTLEDIQPRSQLDQVQGQWLLSLAHEARLTAQRDGKSRITYPTALTARKNDSRAAEVMRLQDQTFQVRKRALDGEIMLYRRQMEQLKQKLIGLNEQKSMREKLVRSFEKERGDLQILASQGYAEMQRVREMERNLAQNEGQRASLESDMSSVELEIGSAELKILRIEQEFQREVAKELAEVQAELFSLNERNRALSDTVKRTTVVAPDDGMVLELAVHTPGEVIRPGQHVLNIVPANEQLMVEVRLLPQDIDQIIVGQTAEVRFSAFRQREMPKIEGKLVMVSADRLIDETSQDRHPYYLARVMVTPKGIRDLANLKLELVPGMPADVFIKTGSRTFWRYMTAPFSDLLVRSMRED